MDNSTKKICLITPGHIASNPRLVKEASALLAEGYRVHIVFTQYMEYLIPRDQALLQAHPLCTFSALNWTKSQRLLRFITAASQRLAIKIASKSRSSKIFHKIILNRNYFWQYHQAVKANADLYIAHNVGALAVAAHAGRKNKSVFAFDAEDFHRGEDLTEVVKQSVIEIENNYLPKAIYLTAASPLIAKEYQTLYQREVSTVLNVFPKFHAHSVQRLESQAVRLFWFSQTIGLDRGIEDIIAAMGILNTYKTVLHLLGAHDEAVKDKLYSLASESGLNRGQLVFHEPIAPDDVLAFSNQFDIGMATETGVPYNRDICLTNKIFTYIQSGLAVIASDTLAQVALLGEFPRLGKVYSKGNPNSLATSLKCYLENPEALLETRRICAEVGESTLNWEVEKQKFIAIIKYHLHD